MVRWVLRGLDNPELLPDPAELEPREVRGRAEGFPRCVRECAGGIEVTRGGTDDAVGGLARTAHDVRTGDLAEAEGHGGGSEGSGGEGLNPNQYPGHPQ